MIPICNSFHLTNFKLFNMKKILCLLMIGSLAACSDDDQADFFMSQNRSEELQGSWKITTNENEALPNYQVFSGDRYFTVSFNEATNKFYADSKKYWYNNETSFFTIGNSSALKKDTPHESRYKLNVTNDTLSIYGGDNRWTQYARYIGELPVK